jgi:acetamidase/formamidase
MAEHTLGPGQVHHKWDNSLQPAIEIEPGDIVHCETAEVTNNQVTPGCDASVCSPRISATPISATSTFPTA